MADPGGEGGGPSGIEVVRYASCPPTPWANGNGSTRVLIDDAPEAGGEWTYRVSVADLSGAQPFSRFPGIHRHLTFLGPGALSLTVNGAASSLLPLDDVEFEGEDAVRSEPSAAAARDLNVMSRRGGRTVRAVQVRAAGVLPRSETGPALWIALEEEASVDGTPLEMLDVARLPAGRPTRAHGRGLLVEIGALGDH